MVRRIRLKGLVALARAGRAATGVGEHAAFSVLSAAVLAWCPLLLARRTAFSWRGGKQQSCPRLLCAVPCHGARTIVPAVHGQ